MQSAAASPVSSEEATPAPRAFPSASTYTVAVNSPDELPRQLDNLSDSELTTLETRPASQSTGGRTSFGMSKSSELRARPTSPPTGGGQDRRSSAVSMHRSVTRSPRVLRSA